MVHCLRETLVLEATQLFVFDSVRTGSAALRASNPGHNEDDERRTRDRCLIVSIPSCAFDPRRSRRACSSCRHAPRVRRSSSQGLLAAAPAPIKVRHATPARLERTYWASGGAATSTRSPWTPAGAIGAGLTMGAGTYVGLPARPVYGPRLARAEIRWRPWLAAAARGTRGLVASPHVSPRAGYSCFLPTRGFGSRADRCAGDRTFIGWASGPPAPCNTRRVSLPRTPALQAALAEASERHGLPAYYRDCVRPLLGASAERWPRCLRSWQAAKEAESA